MTVAIGQNERAPGQVYMNALLLRELLEPRLDLLVCSGLDVEHARFMHPDEWCWHVPRSVRGSRRDCRWSRRLKSWPLCTRCTQKVPILQQLIRA
jgi:hypothetical protein